LQFISKINHLKACLFPLLVNSHSHLLHLACHFTARWCCSRHENTDFHLKHFFKGRLLYQDIKTKRLYYGDIDEPDREEILPGRKKRKAGIKVRATALRQPLISRIVAWRFNTHIQDDLRSVRPPSFIIDDEGIKKLARLHPSNITSPVQVTAALDETPEWDVEWSKLIHEIIQAYDEELTTLRKSQENSTEASPSRARPCQHRRRLKSECARRS
jgi:hypothetical protein